ncbi:hypothetical protein TNIN_165461 [Trichonephila inaurata madagascariensis]|uniref:Uncharacterized protein n=1 Tax=Trichonephila inaurata madagascariensis TaxID=2747483 RepID=A0A8X6XXZ2_9ARAC|nr:hypothetical protein TNIN_165461 [Trichonephila inaurata madagascariensis]
MSGGIIYALAVGLSNTGAQILRLHKKMADFNYININQGTRGPWHSEFIFLGAERDIIDVLRLRRDQRDVPDVRSSAHRKRIDHPGLKISATPAIKKYLDQPGLGSSAAPAIEKYLDHPDLGSSAAWQSRSA